MKSAAHDVDIGKNSDDLRKLERQRIEAACIAGGSSPKETDLICIRASVERCACMLVVVRVGDA